MNFLLVFLGGGLGSILRYSIGEYWNTHATAAFPWHTFIANLLASLILGILLGISLKSGLNKNTELFFMIGLCGGFSTFSTFSKEVFHMIEAGSYGQSLIYILGSVLACVLAIFIGASLK